MSDLLIKKIEGVNLLSSDGAHPVAFVVNDSGKTLLPLAVFIKGNDVSGVTWGPEVGISSSSGLADGNPWLNIFKLKQISKELTDGGQTVALYSVDDTGPDCGLPDGGSFNLWCTRPATAASYTADLILISVILD